MPDEPDERGRSWFEEAARPDDTETSPDRSSTPVADGAGVEPASVDADQPDSASLDDTLADVPVVADDAGRDRGERDDPADDPNDVTVETPALATDSARGEEPTEHVDTTRDPETTAIIPVVRSAEPDVSLVAPRSTPARRVPPQPVEAEATMEIPRVVDRPRDTPGPRTERIATPAADGATRFVERPSGDAEATRFVARPQTDEATRFVPRPPVDDDATAVASVPHAPAADADDRRGPRPGLRRGLLVGAAVLGLFVVVYAADVVLSRGDVPRGVQVAGVSVGGMDHAAAEGLLREQIEPRLTQPVQLRAGDVETELDPASADLNLDWESTLDQAGAQPWNPWTRLTSLFTHREVGVVTATDPGSVSAALEGLRPQTDREPAEGTIRFEGATPIAVDPLAGQVLDVGAGTEAVLADWASGQRIDLPVAVTSVRTTAEGVRRTLDEVVTPAVADSVTVTGEGAEATLEPEVTASALRFAPAAEGGGLDVTIDNPTVVASLGPQLADTEQPGQDAQIVIQGGTPTVQPSTDGRGVDWEASLVPLREVLGRSDERTLPAIYVTKPAELTTEQANQLGITEVISSYDTGGFASDSGQNIRRAAEQVNGSIVRPGEVFSLNGTTGPRNSSTGYVPAGIIDNGQPGRGVGGGVSQFATTLYNASYFAGMEDVEHKEHSYYISRYPAGREATVFEGSIDLKFRNTGETGILIQTAWSPGSITVTFWGTKRFDVDSVTGERTNFTSPQTRTIPAGQSCSASSGSQGFTVTDTRILRDANSGAEVDRQSRRVVYNPQPRIVCAPAPAPAPEPQPSDPALPPAEPGG